MTLLLNCHLVAKAYGSRQLFSEISFGIFKGDKIGLVGPNGSGKSTLLKILAGIDAPDSGSVSYRKSLRIGYVPQAQDYPSIPVNELILSCISESTPTPLHERETEVTILLSKLGFKDPTQLSNQLSGGWKKRLDIAKELINQPDILLLDEPTNHLDLEGILWLENFLQNENIAFIVTSHDRYFLDNVASRIMELNSLYPQGIFNCEGNYTHFLDKRAEYIDYQYQCERSLASKVRREVDWLRQTPKARTTKSSARVQEAENLIQELSQIRTRNKQSTSKIDFESTERETRKLLTAKNLAKSAGDRLLFTGLDLTLSPGMRLGIVGPNGCGKTTLLRLLAGELSPDKGTIKYADGLRIVYFDQHRQQLSPNDSLRRALAPNTDTVIYRGSSIHVNSWAKRFLFTPERLDLPVKQLSGGERARIGIARLMLQPADLLLLDEPTNDLDIPTLETLEESLREFPGAIVLITHDRAMLDSLTTCVLGLGLSGPPPILADYIQWEQYQKEHKKGISIPSEGPKKNKEKEEKKAPVVQKKLSYNEKRELEQMEQTILNVEQEIAVLETELEKYTETNNLAKIQEACHKLESAHKELDRLFARWQELDQK